MGFFGLLRLSDFMLKSGNKKEASLLISGVTWEPEGLVLTLQGTKTDRQNRGQTVTIAATRDSVCPKQALVMYLLVRPRSGSKSLLLNPDGKPLAAWSIRKRLFFCLTLAQTTISKVSIQVDSTCDIVKYSQDSLRIPDLITGTFKYPLCQPIVMYVIRA